MRSSSSSPQAGRTLVWFINLSCCGDGHGSLCGFHFSLPARSIGLSWSPDAHSPGSSPPLHLCRLQARNLSSCHSVTLREEGTPAAPASTRFRRVLDLDQTNGHFPAAISFNPICGRGLNSHPAQALRLVRPSGVINQRAASRQKVASSKRRRPLVVLEQRTYTDPGC